MSKVSAVGFIATSEYIPVYGRAVLSEDDIRRIFASYQKRGVTMIGNHDERNVVDGRVLSVELRRTSEGALGVWAEVEIEEGQLAGYHGWSIGWFEDDYPVPNVDPRPLVKFGADASHFTDQERDEVAAILGQLFRVVGGRYYQLGMEPPATIVLLLAQETIKAFPAAVLAGVLFEGFRRLLPQGKRVAPTLFKFSVVRTRDGSEARGVLETSDAEVLRDALARLKDLAELPSGHYELDDDEWRPLAQKSRPRQESPVPKRRHRQDHGHHGSGR